MTRCTAPEFGKMLHGYELRQLSPEDTARFEEHLLTCDYCFEEASQFMPVAALLVADTEIQELAKRAAKADRTEGVLRRLKALVWPSSMPLVLRPAIAYVALALLIYPAYVGVRNNSGPRVRSTQTVILSGTRGEATPAVESNQPLSIVFRVDGSYRNDTLNVTVADEAGAPIFQDRSFTRLSSSGLGTLTFDRDALAPGRYSLTVSNLADSQLVRYTFQID